MSAAIARRRPPYEGVEPTRPGRLSWLARRPRLAAMWNEPYLETCCRATLHRLILAGAIGRPDGLKDGPCLHRLAAMGLVCRRADSRFEITEAGRARHASEILKRRESLPP